MTIPDNSAEPAGVGPCETAEDSARGAAPDRAHRVTIDLERVRKFGRPPRIEVAIVGTQWPRHEVEIAHAPLNGQSVPGVSERAAALLQLASVRPVAALVLASAPGPGSASAAAAEAGNPTAAHPEEQARIADPLARGSRPYLPLPRRRRRDTRPESPRALRVALAADADGPIRAELPAAAAAANEGGT